MGDSFSLILTIEKAFDIEIAEAEKMTCVGDLQRVVETTLAEKWPQAESGTCVSMMAFHRVRRAAMQLGFEKRALTPKTGLETLLPPENRRAAWENLAREINLTLPQLERSPELEKAIELAFWCLLVSSPISCLLLSTLVDPTFRAGMSWFWFCLLGPFGAWWLMWRLTESWATQFPLGCASVGNLTRALSDSHYVDFVAQRGFWTSNEVWRTLQNLIACEAEVEPEQVTPEARFIEDLDFED